MKLKKESLGEETNDDIELPEGENEQEIVNEDKVDVKEVALHVKFTIKVHRHKQDHELTVEFLMVKL